ncbi:hypothetical protein LZC95_37515 [Pendulispora brunnea]|uniref:Uncharacterized protein n=1 Tax=Pendulispora brunnea TaxID=2905690 RepID=A0ABZ2K3K2_9BACT
MSSGKNPFEAYDIDPREGTRAITERFRELLEDATSDEERERLRAAWEALTLHPAQRVRAAFGAHPVTGALPLPAATSPRVQCPPMPQASVTPFREDPILFPRKK